MHDIADLESRGVVATFVATDEFMTAADAQTGSLGVPSLARVYVPHPVQDRTDDELRAYADEAYEEIVASITAG